MPFEASGSSSRSASRSFADQEVFLPDVFRELFGTGAGSGSGALGAASTIAGGGLTDTANRLFDSGIGFLGDLGGATDVSRSTDFLDDRISGGGSLLDENIAGLQEDLGRFFNEELLPGISDAAIGAGSLGGGRQGVAQGKAAGEIGRTFSRGVTDLRTADIAARDRAAVELAGINLNQGNQRIGAASAGLSALPEQFDLALSGANAPLSPFLALSQILGDPTVLSSSRSSSGSSSGSFGFGGGGGGGGF